MTKQQYDAAQALDKEAFRIRIALDQWERCTQPEAVGWMFIDREQITDLGRKFEYPIPKDIFEGFRSATINALRLRLSEIDKEMAAL